MKIKDMVYASMFAAIIAVLGLMPPIPLPFIPVPITLQTMGVMLAGSFLGKRLGFLSNLLVVILVLLGAPILSGGRGGLAILTGPTGGFFIVWPFSAFLIGLLTEKVWKSISIGKYIFLNIVGGIILVYLVGALYLSFITKMPVFTAILSCVAFIPGDLLKAIVVSTLCYRLKELSPIQKRSDKE